MTGFRIVGGVFTSLLGIVGIIWGIVCLILAVVAFIPLMGWFNWLVIPFTVPGLIFSTLATANSDTVKLGHVGNWLNGTAIALGTLRLLLGGGVI